jgi:glycosyltransferase involved in cell wall biosynthesis
VQASRFVIEQLAPRLKREFPGLAIALVGAKPPTDIVEAADAAGVEVVANPPDVTPYWADAILVVPLFIGSGSRLKIMEAFAHLAPVVTTAKGVEGIGATAGTHYLAAESPDEFVEAIRRLCADDLFRRRLLGSAHTYVSEHHSIDNVADAVAATLGRLQRGAGRHLVPASPGGETPIVGE